MPRQQYAGLCIGGPRGGKMLDHHSPIAAFTVNPRIAEHPLSELAEQVIKIDHKNYVWTAVYSQDGRVFRFWRWQDLTTIQAIEVMAKSYTDQPSTYGVCDLSYPCGGR